MQSSPGGFLEVEAAEVDSGQGGASSLSASTAARSSRMTL